MYSEDFVRAAIKEQGMLPLFYHDDTETCISLVNALYGAGVRCIEFTNRGPQAFQNFEALVKDRDSRMPGLLLGVGTIRTAEEANRFINAGADFLVSPIFDAGVCDAAYIAKVLWIPGCLTPTEIHVAQQAGCNLIKLFPGNLLKPSFVEAIKPLFRGIDFVVTGGVDTTEENISSWFKAGVAGVGMGSKMISKQVMEEKDWDSLKTETLKVMEIIKSVKKN
jgi:2-dehydro-3-deoxyphosphogluconate aldolase/(4S)-4-hydroxy-2-oxoglutarate aldolase